MIKKLSVVAAAFTMVLAPLAGVSSAVGLPCSGGYACDDKDPGPVSWDKVMTDDRALDKPCGSVELRSGKKDGKWYAWARVNVAGGCYGYEAWIDRKGPNGTIEHVLGYCTVNDIQGQNFGNMYYWPDGVQIRAGFKHPNEGWDKSGVTSWH
ncbi:hypothetical protein ABT246_06080 [Streptomyces sp. NPDC001553]|uniref:hypothetical protein n=1 Tax=Streptomyces sp. NPDC001553 TaxID=3154385 RepID=UPI00331DA367